MKNRAANLPLPKTYAELCQLLAPRPIHNAADFRRVTKISDALAGRELNTDQEDYFDLLCRLIEDWERSKVPKPKATALEMLQFMLENHDLCPSDLSTLLGVHRTLGPMILRGERKLTLKHVKTLANRFGISTDAFID